LHIYYIFFTLDPTQPDPPKTQNFVTQPDSTCEWTCPTLTWYYYLAPATAGGVLFL